MSAGLIGVALCSGQAFAQSPSEAGATVAALIERLGDPRYAERRDAQRRLEAVGLRAFDALRAATEHADPEVAAASELLLTRMTARWAWPGDPPRVRQQLANYGEQAEETRLDTIGRLGSVSGELGVAALCRLARFDLSPRVSRAAARALLTTEKPALSDARRDAIRAALRDLEARFGPSDRAAATWLALATADGASADDWRRAFQREAALVRNNDRATDEENGATLGAHWLRAALAEGDTDAAVQAVEQLVTLAPDRAGDLLTRSLEWMEASASWEAVDRVVARQHEALRSKRGLYLQARLMATRGDPDRAERLADEAFAAEADPVAVAGRALGARSLIANELRWTGRAAWAEREYAAACETLEPLTVDAAHARWRLADLRQDAGRYEEAADDLDGLDSAINASDEALAAYKRLYGKATRLLQAPSVIAARRHFYRALALRDRGDRPAAMAALRSAIALDPEDADILIAMHRTPPGETDDDAAFAKETRRRIRALCAQFEDAIAARPDSSEPLNQWAWLVGNTEGDYAKAVRYSRRSLDLDPDNPGLLDTLGRCLYAAGDFDGALRAQRRAVELMPHMQVMQRQLELIEAAAEDATDSGGGTRE